MMYTVQIRKKGSGAIEVVEIPQEIVPLLQLVTHSKENRIDLMEHKNDLAYYLRGSELPGASRIALILNRYDKAFLIKN